MERAIDLTDGEGNMKNDVISRQAAIDALWEIRKEEVADGRRFKNHCSLSTAVDVIRDLPSAQQEIIHCRDCRKYLRLGCPMGITVFDAPDPDGYCYKVERRTDGTD